MSKDAVLWLGTEDSYLAGIDALKKYEAAIASRSSNRQAKADSNQDDEVEKSPYLSVVDGVGIVTVSGAMYDGRFGVIGSWFGIIGYGDIQDALVQAVRDTNVSSILLVMKSGGGTVTGVSETAELIRNVDKIKAVTTYSPSTMGSAALWLGVSARKVYASDLAEVGSIGTLIVLASRAEQLKKDGIEVKVVRSGKYKALGHPAEPLDEKTIEIFQAKADYLGARFLEYVAERRGTSAAAADVRFGQGRTFIGQQALDVGLIDAVKTYSAAFGEARTLALSDNKPKLIASTVATPQVQAHNAAPSEGNTMPNAHVPTPEELAAIAAGVTLPGAEASTEADAAAAAQAAALAAAGGEGEDADDSSATLASLQEQVATLQASSESLVTKLAEATGSLEAASAREVEAQTKIKELEASLVPLNALASIVGDSIRTMAVALNMPAPVLANLPPSAVAEKHAEMAALFRAKYKVGGVAATKPTESEEKQGKPVNPLFAAAATLKVIK